jgi:hypothetical protein
MDENKIEISAPISSPVQAESRVEPSPVSPKISGQRERVQEGIVWVIVLASFIAGLLLTAAFMGRDFLNHNPPYTFQIQDLAVIWAPFITLISGAMGYLFGQHSK